MALPIIDFQLEFIKEQLLKGELRKNIFASFSKKWPGVSQPTFNRRFAVAKKSVLSNFLSIRQQADEDMLVEIQHHKFNIMSIVERQHILSQIARGEIMLRKPIVVKGEIQHIEVAPDWTDRRNAIAELNKMDGAAQPEKETNHERREIIFELGAPFFSLNQ